MSGKKTVKKADEAEVKSCKGCVSAFMERHFHHFNSRETLDAARAYKTHIEKGGKMFLAMAGAMSTAQLGTILAKMIREDKIHAVCSTAANLEEDVYNLVAHNSYKQIPKYYQLSPAEEVKILDDGFARVTDTAIPDKVFKLVDDEFLKLCQKAKQEGKKYFPYEYFYQILETGVLKEHYQVPLEDSWVYAAWQKKIPIYSPGWEDCSTSNSFVAWMRKGLITQDVIRTGLEQMDKLLDWYEENDKTSSIGFFQIGGGIAGDFSICSVPILAIDFPEKKNKLWGYFCQISDSTTSYGSYSGAIPNEKISWVKLDPNTPRFFINSDATVIAPLIFGYVLGE